VINLHRNMTCTQVTKRYLAVINRFNDNVRGTEMCTVLQQVTVSYTVAQHIWLETGRGVEAEAAAVAAAAGARGVGRGA
jgi:hypothetical protein